MRAAVVALLLWCPAAAAERPPLPLAKAPTPLLGGRLTVRLPEKAKVEARQVSIMAAPESGEMETRAVMDIEGARFVVFAQELAQLGGPQFEALAKTAILRELPQARFEPLAVAPPLRALGAKLRPTAKQTANLVYVALVLHPDGTVQRFNAYVSDDGLPAAARWADLGRRTSATLAVGPRTLDLGAGTRRFPGVGKDKLAIKLPEGFLSATQNGHDFSVHHLDRLVPLGAPPENCNVYLGGHPSLIHARAEIPPAEVKKTPGKLLGTAVTWESWTKGPGSCVEAISPHPLEKQLLVHAFCCAPKPDRLTALRPILETLSVEP